MNQTQCYFVEEFAEEYRAGQISRRDLLRRVLLITGSAAATASTLLTLGCSRSSSRTTPPSVPAAASTTGPPTAAPASSSTSGAPPFGSATLPPPSRSTAPVVKEDDPAVRAEHVQFPGPAGSVFAYLARPKSGPPAAPILIVHENQGLVEPILDIARRYAKEGFAALAVDLVSREGGSEKYRTDPAQIPAILARIAPAEHVADLMASIAYLKTHDGLRSERIGVTGFCFGGNLTFALATSAPEIRAAVPYYGTVEVGDLARSQAAFLVFYGATDSRITSQAPAVEQALKIAGRPVEVQIEPGAGHAFFRNSGAGYNPAAARDAWPRTLAWFTRYLVG